MISGKVYFFFKKKFKEINPKNFFRLNFDLYRKTVFLFISFKSKKKIGKEERVIQRKNYYSASSIGKLRSKCKTIKKVIFF